MILKVVDFQGDESCRIFVGPKRIIHPENKKLKIFISKPKKIF